MKKIIISVALLLALLMCMSACSFGKDPGQGQNPPNPPADQTVYETLAELAGKSYTKVTAKIVTKTGDVSLSAEYVLTQSNVRYSIEQLNLLPEDGNTANLSSDWKTTVSGSATVSNGEIVLDGVDVSLPSYDALKGAFKFDESNFTGVSEGSGTFEASVVSPSVFYDAAASVQNMKVAVEYSENALNKVVITYQTAGTSVTATYTFEA